MSPRGLHSDPAIISSNSRHEKMSLQQDIWQSSIIFILLFLDSNARFVYLMFLELCSQKLFHQTTRPILHNGHKTQEIYVPNPRNVSKTEDIYQKQEINVTRDIYQNKKEM